MKNLIYTLIAIILATHMSAIAFEVDGLVYETDGNGVTVSADNTSSLPAKLVIPAKVTDENNKTYDVISIKASGFKDCSSIEEIEISDGILSIGSSAFSGCTKVQKIIIPKSVEKIGSSAFYDAHALTELKYNPINCTLADNDYPNYIFDYAGKNSEGFAVTIGKDVSEIPPGLFYPRTSTSYAKIISLSFEEGSVCETIGSSSFYNCVKLVSVDWSASLKNIDSYAFCGCTGITEVIIPEGVEQIGKSAFHKCSSVKKIVIPSTVTAIGSYCFYKTFALTELYYKPVQCILAENASNNYIFELAGTAGAGCAVTIGKDVLSIPDRIFYPYYAGDCAKITSLSFEEGSVCESIGASAFSKCSKLASIDWPASLKVINSSAFYECSSITEVVIPEGVEQIGKSAFNNCSAVKKIVIPSTVTAIGSFCFYNTSALTELYYNPIQCILAENASNNYIFELAGKDGAGCSVTIGKDVPSIPDRLFYPYYAGDCAKITSLSFEEGSVCESIGTYAFSECSKLARIDWPASLKVINPCAFYECSSISELIIPEGVEQIGKSAFFKCSAVKKIVIPSTVSAIGSFCFYKTSALTELYYNPIQCILAENASNNYIFELAGTDGTGCAVTIGKDVSRIPNRLFYPYYTSDCPQIKSIFFEKEAICEEIGSYAFAECTALKEINLPATINKIGQNAFNGCKSLEIICSLNPEPPTAEKNTFSNSTYNDAQLWIQSSSGEKYSTASCWKEFVKVNYRNSQAIIWDQNFSEIYDNEIILLTATATSGLKVNYTIIEGQEFATIDEETDKLIFSGSGTVTIVASQPGNYQFEPAEDIKVTFDTINGINGIINDENKPTVIFRLNGMRVFSDVNSLTPGFYIINGKKVFVK